MRFWGLFLLVALCGSCTSLDPAPAYLRMDYQLRCLDCGSADEPKREIKALDGERNFAVDCFVSERGGKKLLSFSALHRDADSEGSSYLFKMTQVRLDSKDPGADCKVFVEEGGTPYSGKCTGGDPTDEEPCEVHLDLDGDIVDGTVFCKHLAAQGNTGIWRHVVDPFSTSAPAVFELRNCSGI